MMQWTPKTVAITAGAVFLGAWFLKGQAGKVVQAVNPTNRDNVFNSAFNRGYSAVTGSEDSLGADIADGVQNVKDWWADDEPEIARPDRQGF